MSQTLKDAPVPHAATGRSAAVDRLVLISYTATIFLSATLLFLIQPMFARMLLPLLGGSPAVWNTATLCYQTLLLAGYGYAHLTGGGLPARRQLAVHALVVLVPLLVLPIAVPAGWSPPTDSSPVPWMIGVILAAVGLPFFVLSATNPLVQRWFSLTGHPAAKDPYFLYVASNAGSMLGLLSYPFVLEPGLRLGQQSLLWSVGYGLFAAMILACGLLLRGRAAHPAAGGVAGGDTSKLALPRRLRWIALAALPSSLMLSVTTFISTDIAPFPLLWAIPLALYLLTFIVAFSARPLIPDAWLARLVPVVLITTAILSFRGLPQSLWLIIPLHLAAFTLIAVACHRLLARDRPAPRHLTTFYLDMSIGGAVGGLFNAIIAPLVFSSVLEYPLGLLAAALLLLPWPRGLPQGRLARALLVGAPLALIAAALAAQASLRGDALLIVGGGVVIAAAAYVLANRERSILFAGGLAAMLVAFNAMGGGSLWRLVLAERTFFGVNWVAYNDTDDSYALFHGRTIHGTQYRDPALRLTPTTYYHPAGPLGAVFADVQARSQGPSVAVVGLGAGSLACYARPGESWTFFEIDPSVAWIARDSGFFSYLGDCAPDAAIVLGDGRRSLEAVAPGSYDLLVVDAFSSDSIPVHLITREAIDLYRATLRPGGVVAMHISNNYLDLAPVLGGIARDLGMAGRIMRYTAPPEVTGASSAHWVILASDEAALAGIAADPAWAALPIRDDLATWTDDFASILSVLK